MFVENIMTREVLHVAPEASFSQVSEIMRLKKVRHVPVIDQDRKVLGIISHRDVQRAQPSMITTLDVGEVKYLLSKITAADIMHKSVVSCSPRDADRGGRAHDAAQEAGVCLTVVDDAGRLVGIVTSVDLLDFFLDITGCWVEGATRITVKLQDRAGQLAPRCSPRSMRRAATSSRWCRRARRSPRACVPRPSASRRRMPARWCRACARRDTS